MNNEVFNAGELSTHFIEEQSHLLQEMKRIIEEERSLQEKLSTIFRQDKRIAAAASAVEAYLARKL
jgi:pyruvate carboxylase subunit A